ncbi:MAG: nucleotidyltransferase family protein [Ruminiclostridium sp.]|nr:nucleotidyltransferase family protein [Ruminiclostridium sp.]MBQ8410146.1 nucleotidyltransferase family protein [Ruminiclostridium sp.]MBQ8841511.1 nucleotidyltransferase family protein [Ruminiclostridium sp.]
MKICGIIAEYNPFHNGHKYQIEETKRRFGATHTVAVMSGNFTQRGDTAIFDKYKRAEVALKNGVDLVIELPVAYALGSAEQFALGAVSVLQSLGCVDMLSFGSECGDIDLLHETAGAVVYAQQHDDFFRFMRSGDTLPVALQKTIEKYYESEIIETLAEPNNTLAVEYLKAMDEMGCLFEPVTIGRTGTGHDSDEVSENIASASKIRKMILAGEDVSAFVPELPDGETADIRNLETAILAKLRMMSQKEIEKAPNVLMGLENRIYKSARVATNLAELYMLIKTKRYTLARIRRIVLACFLGIKKSDLKKSPSYIRILGMNGKGREILAKADCKLPMDTSLKALMKSGDVQKRQAYLEEVSGNMYALAYDKKKPCGLEYTSKPVILP